MTDDLRISVEDHPEVVLVRVAGEVDLATAPRMRSALLGAMSNQDHVLVADLSETTYMDSAGIRVLFEAARRLAARQQGLRLVIPADSLIRVAVSVTTLPERLRVAATLDDALRPRPTDGPSENGEERPA